MAPIPSERDVNRHFQMPELASVDLEAGWLEVTMNTTRGGDVRVVVEDVTPTGANASSSNTSSATARNSVASESGLFSWWSPAVNLSDSLIGSGAAGASGNATTTSGSVLCYADFVTITGFYSRLRLENCNFGYSKAYRMRIYLATTTPSANVTSSSTSGASSGTFPNNASASFSHNFTTQAS
ncbi:unnamed protein product, partial [Amoebophrya sp. A25]|eukprot:GSA25T00014485001.1